MKKHLLSLVAVVGLSGLVLQASAQNTPAPSQQDPAPQQQVNPPSPQPAPDASVAPSSAALPESPPAVFFRCG